MNMNLHDPVEDAEQLAVASDLKKAVVIGDVDRAKFLKRERKNVKSLIKKIVAAINDIPLLDAMDFSSKEDLELDNYIKAEIDKIALIAAKARRAVDDDVMKKLLDKIREAASSRSESNRDEVFLPDAAKYEVVVGSLGRIGKIIEMYLGKYASEGQTKQQIVEELLEQLEPGVQSSLVSAELMEELLDTTLNRFEQGLQQGFDRDSVAVLGQEEERPAAFADRLMEKSKLWELKHHPGVMKEIPIESVPEVNSLIAEMVKQSNHRLKSYHVGEMFVNLWKKSKKGSVFLKRLESFKDNPLKAAAALYLGIISKHDDFEQLMPMLDELNAVQLEAIFLAFNGYLENIEAMSLDLGNAKGELWKAIIEIAQTGQPRAIALLLKLKHIYKRREYFEVLWPLVKQVADELSPEQIDDLAHNAKAIQSYADLENAIKEMQTERSTQARLRVAPDKMRIAEIPDLELVEDYEESAEEQEREQQQGA